MAKRPNKLNEAKQAQDTEETIKNNVRKAVFKNYDCSCLDRIDFTVADAKNSQRYYYWAEAKRSKDSELAVSITQLILTMGKEKTLNKVETPPSFIGAFDPVKIAFVPFHKIMHIFSKSDFNWNVTPSDHTTKEFKELYALVKPFCDDDGYYFTFEDNEKDLKQFIADNFTLNTEVTALEVDKNNFVHVFHQWLKEVKDSINYDWSKARKVNVIESDFFLADLFSEDNIDIRGGYVTLDRNKYVIHEGVDDLGGEKEISVKFKDHQEAHKRFWKRYKRPPKKDFWEYILERRDLLVPQDVRERKGSFFTPQQWVQLSQKYLADVLGEDWQDDYYVWDCAAGTGNLLAGLTNKRNLFASTLDKADVAIMKESAREGALSLFEGNIFQFDFLNDDLNGDKVPDALKEILKDQEERKKLVIYINPPFAEATNAKTITGTGKHRSSVSVSAMKSKYQEILKQGAKELYILFLTRIYFEISDCIIANFSTIKFLRGVHYKEFRNIFLAKIEKLFIVPSNTFDNVPGKFPIGFFIWNTTLKEKFQKIKADVILEDFNTTETKLITVTPPKNIKDWLRKYNDKKTSHIAYLVRTGADFHNNKVVFITWTPSESVLKASNASFITENNLLVNAIFFAVRKALNVTWVNNKDEYLYPTNTWQTDTDFHTNCLAFTLFHTQNRISADDGVNHWIPFTEDEVGARQRFQSDFMTKFINGKYKPKESTISLLPDTGSFIPTEPLNFSQEAQEVFNVGREIWRYYHQNDMGGVTSIT